MDPIWYCKTCGTLGDKKEVCCGAMMVSLDEAVVAQRELFREAGNDRAARILYVLKQQAQDKNLAVRKAEAKVRTAIEESDAAMRLLLDFFKLETDRFNEDALDEAREMVAADAVTDPLTESTSDTETATEPDDVKPCDECELASTDDDERFICIAAEGDVRPDGCPETAADGPLPTAEEIGTHVPLPDEPTSEETAGDAEVLGDADFSDPAPVDEVAAEVGEGVVEIHYTRAEAMFDAHKALDGGTANRSKGKVRVIVYVRDSLLQFEIQGAKPEVAVLYARLFFAQAHELDQKIDGFATKTETSTASIYAATIE